LQFYTNRTNNEFEILAISLDTYYSEWQNYIECNKFTWINVSYLKGWKNKVSYDYYKYDTPTMFFLINILEELKTAF